MTSPEPALEKVIFGAGGIWGIERRVAGESAPAPEFFPAEEYRPRYYQEHAVPEDSR
jgi:hypothetical protein